MVQDPLKCKKYCVELEKSITFVVGARVFRVWCRRKSCRTLSKSALPFVFFRIVLRSFFCGGHFEGSYSLAKNRNRKRSLIRSIHLVSGLCEVSISFVGIRGVSERYRHSMLPILYILLLPLILFFNNFYIEGFARGLVGQWKWAKWMYHYSIAFINFERFSIFGFRLSQTNC